MHDSQEGPQFVIESRLDIGLGKIVFTAFIRAYPPRCDEVLEEGCAPDLPPSGAWWCVERRGNRHFACVTSPVPRAEVLQTFGPLAAFFLRPGQRVVPVITELEFEDTERALEILDGAGRVDVHPATAGPEGEP